MTGFDLGEKIKIRNGVICAPICGATKAPYRQLAQDYGADLCYTEMIKAVALIQRNRRSLELAIIGPDEKPVGAQLCGAEPEVMAEAGRIIEELGFATVDINMGCPVKKVISEGAGAAMMRSPETVYKVVKAMSDAVSIPVTIKIRTGWTHDEGNAPLIAQTAEQAGAKMISIHGRARSVGHKGEVDMGAIAKVKELVSIPVVGNGGIMEPEDAPKMLRATGCDAVMIGRGGYGRPWFFRDCARAIRGEAPGPKPLTAELRRIATEHYEGIIKILGPETGSRTYRKYAAWYFTGVPFGTYFRDMAFRSQSPAELRELIDAFFDFMAECDRAREAGLPPEIPKLVEAWQKGPKPAWAHRNARCDLDSGSEGDCED